MGYWKSKVVPTMKKLFERSLTKKAVVVEASKSLTFDESKEAINKEIEEKRTELTPKVVEIYEATSAELKALVREPKEDGLTKHSEEVHKFLEALVEIGFPGSKAVCETSSSLGPVTFIFEKVCLFLPAEEKAREVEIVEEKETKPEEKSREIEIVEEKKEEVKPAEVPVPVAAEEKKPAVEEEKKAAVEEKKPAEEEKKVAVEEKKPAVEEKKPAVEEKKPVEEVKKEVVAAAPVAATPATKAPETPVVETPAKAPATPAAEPQKA
uniref:Plasma membrane-associated cation-binding protein 1 n=1 Tax=Noccaea caerulescens TaxID=107243 RepID=A0A1J3G4K6_NOCCA